VFSSCRILIELDSTCTKSDIPFDFTLRFFWSIIVQLQTNFFFGDDRSMSSEIVAEVYTGLTWYVQCYSGDKH
jgi:hypothetical protein